MTKLHGVVDEDLDAARWQAVEVAGELMMQAQFKEALVELRKVLTVDSDNPYAYHHLGVVFYELKEFEPARDAYRAALNHAPKYRGARLGLSHVLRLLKDPLAAAREAQQVLTQYPDDGDALYAAGMANAAAGNRKRALRQLRSFLKTKPELELQLEIRGTIKMLDQLPEGDSLELS